MSWLDEAVSVGASKVRSLSCIPTVGILSSPGGLLPLLPSKFAAWSVGDDDDDDDMVLYRYGFFCACVYVCMCDDDG